MPIPSVKTIRDRLRWLDKTAASPDEGPVLLRQAMEWWENRGHTTRGWLSGPGRELEEWMEREGLSPWDGADLHEVMTVMDMICETHGIDYLTDKRDNFRHSHGIEYLNTGDPYTPTIMYDWHKDRWIVGAWGDEVERQPDRFE